MASSSLSKLRASWAIQVRVIHALMIRELITRFGRDNIGFLWIMAEPLLFAGLVGALWHFTHGATEHGINVIAFVATGYIPITLFRHGVSRSVAVFTVNQSLLYHRQIKIVDFILTRFVIEFLGGMMAYLFMAIVLMIFGQFPMPADFGLLIAGWFLYSSFCFAICLIIAPLSEMSEAMEKFIPATTYIMIPFSGLFYMLSWLTPAAREFLLLSPFVNGMEMMRKGIWGDQVTVYYNIWNPIICSAVAALIGLILCRRVRRMLTVE
ncbi:ABC transporter permease [Sphingobium sp. Ant17]|uniref:ABC transporter permease n=1 Tax=Sphingobium sp. Ant17 TaxID=1461752 RepID=UPI0004536FDC|nr:ABC transporter permease [Sphingobium sp. Ant17]EXS68684.1 capsule biosynthesis protein [Sphingobium sp. Ant17]OHC90653.1 MAG: capsule biosynthesis protein [Sphingomonadales bacterium GWF1_63_6]OHD01917.1 MAG: capsule biosynthesis protein [Sphingomonadales bacterium RIFCSPLOWO2_12_FULL_63_15]|tara:strand:+ start:18562 stop:19359 length:798 start_codon:yes stop_codon:yes gene_type:complete